MPKRLRFLPHSHRQRLGSPQRRSPIVLLLLLLLMWCACLGMGLAQAIEVPRHLRETIITPQLAPELTSSWQAGTALAQTPNRSTTEIGTVDVVPDRYKAGQEIYLQNCATCHIGIPPAVLPTETWRDLLQDAQHYGATLKPLVDPNRFLVWNYLKTFSRLRSLEEEQTPYRIADSRYFRALHPQVKLPRKFSLESCVTCHPGVNQFNFRKLTAAAEKG